MIHNSLLNLHSILIFLMTILSFLTPVCSVAAISGLTSSTTSLGRLERYKLPNGMTVILQEMHHSPVVAIQMWCKKGSIHEGKYLGTGISHFVEHMLFKGTEKRQVNQMAQEIRDAGGTLNAYVSFDRIVFHIVIPSRYFDIGLDCLADAIMNSRFDSDEVEKERQVILKEINMNEDDPNRVVSRLLWSTAYRIHPYRHPVLGYRNLVSKISREQLLDYYRRVFIPDNLILVITGDFNIDEVKPKINKQFENFHRTIYPKTYIPIEPQQLGLRRIEKNMDINQTYLKMGYHIPAITHPDVYPLHILAILLGQERSSRLHKELIANKGLVHSISAFSWTPAYPGLFAISAILDDDNLDLAINAILDEINKIKKHGVNRREIARAKKNIESEQIFNRQTVEEKARILGNDELVTGDIHFSEKYLREIRKVTAADIQRVAKKYFHNDNLTIAALRPEISEQQLPEKTMDTTQKTTERNEINKYVLPNGMRLLIQENDNLPIVSIRAVFKGGVLFETEENNGISNLMANMLLRGTKQRSADQIADSISSVGGKIDVHSGSNSFGVSIDLLKDDLPLGIDILSDIIQNPLFPKNDFEREKERLIGTIRAREDDPFTIASKLFRRTFFTSHPYRLTSFGEVESLSQLQQNDIIDFHEKLAVPRNMVLAIFGDIDSRQVKELVKKYFTKFDSTHIPELDIPQEPPLTTVREAVEFKDKAQAIILIGFPGIDVKHNDRYAFDVLNSILSGQGSRLFDNIREKQGLAYFVGAFNIIGIHPGSYVLYAGTVDEKVNQVKDSLLNEIRILRNYGPTDDELDRAINEVIGNKSIEQQKIGSVAFESALDELYNLGYDNFREYNDKINTITQSDIMDILNKYFKDDIYVVTIVRPSKNLE